MSYSKSEAVNNILQVVNGKVEPPKNIGDFLQNNLLFWESVGFKSENEFTAEMQNINQYLQKVEKAIPSNYSKKAELQESIKKAYQGLSKAVSIVKTYKK